MNRILAVLVNYGDEQINYLEKVINELKSFRKYHVTIMVNSNIPLNIKGIDILNIHELDDYQLLPSTCRKDIWENRKNYDVFLYGENDHLFLEKHIDNHLKYEKLLPKNRVSGLIQYEQNNLEKFYPGYHAHFDWDYKSIEKHGDKYFAHFTNLHQATFILSQNQLIKVGSKINFVVLHKEKPENEFYFKLKKKMRGYFSLKTKRKYVYSRKCKVNSDIYEYAGLKKMICISDFEDNLIHHLPNLYINGDKGRWKNDTDPNRMDVALKILFELIDK
ncbi:hypothetical protein ULMA_18090 [Patiriisocius marinus]|uniref:Uncharacterized protein n=1 Tax=Patiriisocius marinus TaxID=1397112 RepID=A0A5J4J1P2_9FLAO|nr:hypothetical protein [Patiriisocius marinus]GER59701.1 hypothetical protein ULMA_18090 [Patiriisocius marinus]